MKNLLTDISGVRVGHADDATLASGVTAVIFDHPAVASIDVRGGGPGTREEALLDPQSMVETIDGIALAGGSALGLDAAGGVQAWLAEHGRGFRIGPAVIPIVRAPDDPGINEEAGADEFAERMAPAPSSEALAVELASVSITSRERAAASADSRVITS